MTSDAYLKGSEELIEATPQLIIQFAKKLSEQNGGNLGLRATLNGIKTNISWCIGHGYLQIHDNYLKPLTGFYVNSGMVSAGKTLDKLMHEADILAVSETLYNLRCDISL